MLEENSSFAIVGYGRMGKLVEKVLDERGALIPHIIDPNLVPDEVNAFYLTIDKNRMIKNWRASNVFGKTKTAICFTTPEAGYETTKKTLESGVNAVVGTTEFYLNEDGSLNQDMLKEFDNLAKQNKCKMIYASNFSVGMNAFWKHLGPLAEDMSKLGYDVAVESKFPGVANALHIAQDYHNDCDRVLENPELTQKALQILNSGKPYKQARAELENLVQEHEGELIKKGFPILSKEDKERIEKEIKTIPFDRDAEQYFAFLVAEMNTSPKYGQKRSIDPSSAEHGLYLQSAFVGSGSRREEKSVVRYAKSLAWLQNQDEVNLDHLTQVAPYVLRHRVKWTPETENTFRDNDREDPLDLHITKTLLNDGTNEMPGVKKRFTESQENYQRVIDLEGNGETEQAIKEAKEYSANGKGHPIFLDTLKELQRR